MIDPAFPIIKDLSKSLLEEIVKKLKESGKTSIPATELVSEFETSSNASGIDARRALWYLVDLKRLRFVEGRNIALDPNQETINDEGVVAQDR